MEKIKPSHHLVRYSDNLTTVLKKLEELPGDWYRKIVFVLDESERCVGSITDGDIRRAIMSHHTAAAGEIMNQSFRSLRDEHVGSKEIAQLVNDGIFIIPVLNDNDEVLDILDLNISRSNLKIDAFILAGGKGMRLRPLTENLPKPLLKVGNKAILEHNVDRLSKYGIKNIHISLNYLGDKIVEHFGDGTTKHLNIRYVTESTPLGTLGSIGLVQNFESEYVLVMNSDLLTDLDFEDFYMEMAGSDADMIVATVPYSYSVPYAIVETTEVGEILSLNEKPTYTYYANAGIYLIKSSLLDNINGRDYLDAPDMIESLISKGKKVLSYPIRSYWLDIGKMEDYKKAQDDINHIHL